MGVHVLYSVAILLSNNLNLINLSQRYLYALPNNLF